MIPLKFIKAILPVFEVSKIQTELFVSNWEIDNFGGLLNENEKWIIFFFKKKATLKHLKTVTSSDPRVHL